MAKPLFFYMASEPHLRCSLAGSVDVGLNPKSPATQSRSPEGAPQEVPYCQMDKAACFQAAGGVDETRRLQLQPLPQVPGRAGFTGCRRCGSMEHRAANCGIQHSEQAKKPLRHVFRAVGEEAAKHWLMSMLDDIRREEEVKKQRKEKKKSQKNERRRKSRKERKFREGYTDMREWARQLDRNSREGRARQMRIQEERKFRDSKKKTERRVKPEKEVSLKDTTKTLNISKDQVRSDGQKDQTDKETKTEMEMDQIDGNRTAQDKREHERERENGERRKVLAERKKDERRRKREQEDHEEWEREEQEKREANEKRERQEAVRKMREEEREKQEKEKEERLREQAKREKDANVLWVQELTQVVAMEKAAAMEQAVAKEAALRVTSGMADLRLQEWCYQNELRWCEDGWHSHREFWQRFGPEQFESMWQQSPRMNDEMLHGYIRCEYSLNVVSEVTAPDGAAEIMQDDVNVEAEVKSEAVVKSPMVMPQDAWEAKVLQDLAKAQADKKAGKLKIRKVPRKEVGPKVKKKPN